MIKYLLLVLSVSFAFAKQEIKSSNIRILLEKKETQALLEVRGPYYIFNPYDHSRISSGILSKRFIVRPISTGIKWGQEFLGIHQILIVPRSKNTKILLNGIEYDGAIAIYKIQNKINVVNEIDIESYLKSTLSSSFDYPLEQEVMAAVAIAARTTAYFQINKNSFWDIDKKDINYQGSALTINDSNIVKAINDTSNIILLNNKKPFAALWNEHSAGKTAPLKVIFRKDLNAPENYVETPHAALSKKDSLWEYSMALKKFSDLFEFNKVESIKPFQDEKTNKIYAIRLEGNEETKDINFLDLQKKLKPENLKSNDFVFSIENNKIYFKGYGIGHGVGICLLSASQKAQNGEDAAKILSTFYPNTEIVNISSKKSKK